jgi:predicted nucleotidyltransferase
MLAVGAQVVTRTEVERPGGAPRPHGAVGVVVATPSHDTETYRVRFGDGTESSLPRGALTIRKHYQWLDPASRASALSDLHACVIYHCVVGSRAYGLDEPDSDVDRQGIYLPQADLHWSLAGVPEQLENHDDQECYWELERFLRLALKANRNVLECLYTPLVEHTTPLAGELHGTISNADLAFHEDEYVRLRSTLQQAAEASTLPELPTARPALHDLLVRLRLGRASSV